LWSRYGDAGEGAVAVVIGLSRLLLYGLSGLRTSLGAAFRRNHR